MRDSATIVFGDSVMNLENVRFNINGTTNLYCKTETPATVSSSTFSSYESTLHVPFSSTETYMATEWRHFYIKKNGLQHDIAVNSNDSTKGVADGSGKYWETERATIRAMAQEGYDFKGWNDGDISNPRIVTVSQDSSFTAIFAGRTADTVVVKDTVVLRDTIMVSDTLVIYQTDTVYIYQTDTAYIYQTDTAYIYLTDTVYLYQTDTAYIYQTDTAYIYQTDTAYIYQTDTVYIYQTDTVYLYQTDTIYLEYDSTAANQYALEDYGVYYFMGTVVNRDNIYIKLYSADGKLLKKGDDDLEMGSYPDGIYIVTDGKGGFLKIIHTKY